MIKKTITYTDYNGNERTEDFYFHLTKAEIIELELGTSGGLVEMINRITSAQDVPEILKVFKTLVLKGYGEKSADGKRFMKVDSDGSRLSDKFEATEAYSILFMELATDPEAATKFINGMVPSDVSNVSVAPASVLKP